MDDELKPRTPFPGRKARTGQESEKRSMFTVVVGYGKLLRTMGREERPGHGRPAFNMFFGTGGCQKEA